MESRYPFILVHGIVIKDFKFLRAFGRIEKLLKAEGYRVYTAKTDGFGTIESNAEQLKKHVGEILEKENTDKINIIAHSKGGLDSKYMIEQLGMSDRVASLTTLCTPHKGSQIATQILRMPKFFKKFIAFWVNTAYRIFGDKKPDALRVCEQLKSVPNEEIAPLNFSDKVYCQSYSANLEKSRDDFIMGIPLIFSKHWEKEKSDGLVSATSSEFGNYRGEFPDGSVSHLQIVGFAASKKKKEKIYAFYKRICEELTEMGF